MLGGLVTALFSGTMIKEWCEGEQAEQKDRNLAKKHGNKLYVDKFGNYRHTDTGKKYNTEDGKQAYKEFCKKQDIREQKWNETYDEIEKDYISYYNDFIKNKYNLSYEEWIMASQDIMSRLYQKYKENFSEQERKKLMEYGIDNKLRRW